MTYLGWQTKTTQACVTSQPYSPGKSPEGFGLYLVDSWWGVGDTTLHLNIIFELDCKVF